MDAVREEPTQALFSWGANSYGQLGLGHKEDVLLPQALKELPCSQKNITSITGGGGHSVIVTDTGELFLCGQNKDGQLGLGHTEDVEHFTLCLSLSGCPVVQVACGWDFTIILTGNGQVLSCGSHSFGQLGVPDASGGNAVPQKIKTIQDKVVNVAAGLRHAVAVTENGSVFQWGVGMASQVKRACQGQMVPSFWRAKEPCKVTGLENIKVKSITSGSHHVTSLTDEGELYVWGSNRHKQLVSKDDFLLKPQKIEAHYFGGEKVRRVWNGWTHMVAQTETGKVFTWGRGDYGQLGWSWMLNEGESEDGKKSTEHCLKKQISAPVAVPSLTGASEIACGSEHNLAIVGSQCFSWGWNEHGMCGNGTEANVCVPQPVGTLSSAKLLLIGCGAGHSMAYCHLPRFNLPP
ncbi:secretion-regulating guanine nucleotide exchange factor isoform X1 [Podarcis raffonei]|uniref:secretion-regulating guanine nucleotide exchange factor isoform X1 n=1 Tax=Podarcis raffonei TaxID=65483 RepID=UPI0023293830|nr:secretion-regulating guanine nucleotide exchange factor isoform X1 [Podarcis raffonei]XP_053248949.1 secretion-regulating guanine nucleotide exchange factor isoform X1 [Podarcis raffonei]